MAAFEVLPAPSGRQRANGTAIVLPAPDGDGATTVETTEDAWLTSLGLVPPGLVDLFRVAAGAYVADRLTPRGQRFVRQFNLHVQVTAEPWKPRLTVAASALLRWLTGDTWNLTTETEQTGRPAWQEKLNVHAKHVMLLSGGLDSFCGAIVAGNATDHIYVSHHAGNAHRHPQNNVRNWLSTHLGCDIAMPPFHLTQAGPKKEASTRTRILLFLSYAAAVAASEGATSIVVPENGYTSINPPLTAARVGALSTRSTHPTTLHWFSHLANELGGRDMTADNPHASMTKGELVTEAAAQDDVSDGIRRTITCSKLDGNFYKGGSAYLNCGLCVPCIVRRASIQVGIGDDQTVYLVDRLNGESRQRLIRHRQGDITAVRYAREKPLTVADIIALGPYPPSFNYDTALDLCNRGLSELREVTLP